jgi:peptidoglycan hydrolase-like protein with peptidoglycan-binding domain
MFSTYPSYNFFRTLQLLSPQQQGEDVYALQTALIECGFNCGTPDGILGPMTASAISAAQKTYSLTVDGKAGGATQSALALRIAHAVALELKIPYECFKGQLETESGYRLGAYSPWRLDGTYDAGVAQRNTKYTSPQSGFDAKASIGALGDTIRKHYEGDLEHDAPAGRRSAAEVQGVRRQRLGISAVGVQPHRERSPS